MGAKIGMVDIFFKIQKFDRIDGELMELLWFISQDSIRCSSRDFDRIDGELMELLWNIVPGFDTLQLCDKVKELLADEEKPRKNSQEEFYSCRCSTTSPVERETMKKNATRMLNSFLYVQKDLEQDNGHFWVLVQERRGVLSVQTVHKVNGTQWRRN